MGRGFRARSVIALAMAVALFGCGDDGSGGSPPVQRSGSIVIGSFDFGESEVLAFVYGQALQAKGMSVDVQRSIGPRELLMPALAKGLVDVVPEYAGSALAFVSLGRSQPSADPAQTHVALVEALRQQGRVEAMASSPAQNANAVVVTATVADRFGLRTISDLSRVDDQLVFGGPAECPSRPFCLQGLEAVYGLHFKEFVTLDPAGSTTHDALAAAHIDVALLFTTDPAIRAGGLVALADDRHLQPADNITPLVNAAALARWGDPLADVLDAVSHLLTTDELRELNDEVAGGTNPADAAAQWLEAEGLT